MCAAPGSLTSPRQALSLRRMVDLLVDGDEELSRAASWHGDFVPRLPSSEQLRIAIWARRGLAACARDAGAADAAAAWIAAVQGTWWVAALSDLYRKDLVGNETYRAVIGQDLAGQVVWGMRWLRHLHIHNLRISGQGGAKRNFFGGGDVSEAGLGPPFYISPSNRWLPADQLLALEDDRGPKEERQRYEQHVAGRPLRATLESAGRWFDRLASACGHPSTLTAIDPTVL